MSQPIVLLIVGEGRSGSTIIEEALSQIQGIKALGEVQFIWKRGYFDDQLCGCGEPIRSCPFWCLVFKNLLSSLGDEGVHDWLARTQYDSIMRFPLSLLRHYFLPNYSRHSQYFRLVDKIYSQAVSDERTKLIIDSSKSIHYAYFLLKYSKSDIRVLHLVRDPRGVTNSRSKKKIRKEVIGRREFMPRLGVGKSSLRWLIVNQLAEWLVKPASSLYTRIKYEDFAIRPSMELGMAFRNLGLMEMAKEIDKLFDGARFGVRWKAHSISGNPIRFNEAQEKVVRLDETWREELPLYKKKIIELVTWPLAKKYQYI